MAKQIINVGVNNNDKTGDTLRAGGLKIKSNFDEIYNALAVDGLNISGGNLLKTGSYNDLLNKPSFSPIATSGSFNDLTNKPDIGIFVGPPANAQGVDGHITGNFAFDGLKTNLYVCTEDYVTQPLISNLTLVSDAGYTFILQYHTAFDPILTAYDAGSPCSINPTVDSNWRPIVSIAKVGTTVEVVYSGALITNTSQLRIRVEQPNIWKTVPFASVFEGSMVGNPFDQNLNTTNSVEFTKVTSPEIEGTSDALAIYSNWSKDTGISIVSTNSLESVTLTSDRIVAISTNFNVDKKDWIFGSDGSLTLPNGGKLQEFPAPGAGSETLLKLTLENPVGNPWDMYIGGTAIVGADPNYMSVYSVNQWGMAADGTSDKISLGLLGSNDVLDIIVGSSAPDGKNGSIQLKTNGLFNAPDEASIFITANQNYTWKFSGANGSLTFPDSSVQTGAAISLADLKTLVAASTDFADFQVRIAAL